ncbi:MAG TPA: DUF4097 family beta strand repeat-containing protein [Gammaproteobacteria bacterium]|nr:DUF4097 family beta strand repeat-containing protein [Gammaproteobacteria bacterium]
MPTIRPLATLLTLLVAAAAAAQPSDEGKGCAAPWGGWRNREQVCEVRELTLRPSGKLTVDASPNGGISVVGANRRDVLVRAVVRAWAASEDDARAVLEEIVVRDDAPIRAQGPSQSNRKGWSVSYEIEAPRNTDLDLDTTNGGLSIKSVRGDMDFATTNGGIRLDGVAGNVRARTTNGGVDVTLTGNKWDGDALDLRTTNGGVRMRVPEDYSARLETRTVNGGLHVDFPVTVQGRIGHEMSTTLGKGGALVRAETTNGGVHVSRY